MIGACKMRFARIRAQLECRLDGAFCQRPLFRSMLTQSIQRVMGASELTLRREEGGIARQRLIEQIDSITHLLPLHTTEAEIENEILCPAVELESRYVRGRWLLNRTFLGRRELGL